MMRWRSSTWARWLGWTVLFSLAQFGAAFVLAVYDQVLPGEAFWVLLAGLVTLAFAIGLRLRTGWWAFGPVVAYGVPAAISLITTIDADQAPSGPAARFLVYAVVAVIVGIFVVMAPCALAALGGVAYATGSRLPRDARRGGKRPGVLRRWLLPPPGSATPRDVLVAHSMAMTAPPLPSTLQQEAAVSIGQPWEPSDRIAGIPGLTVDDGASDA